ncbi:MAG TPA: hypothetical protein VJ302_05010 [Blastocatellia bacterium]|nr:hypothetical protein [Blastocatellia bacterium]
MFAVSPHQLRQRIPVASAKVRLLLIGDSAEHLRELQFGIKSEDFEVKYVTSLPELGRACNETHDLVVLAARPSNIAAMLKMIRASAGYAGIPVLVECTNLNNDQSLAGVLPRYRAMPCNRAEMLTLLRHHKETVKRDLDRRGML